MKVLRPWGLLLLLTIFPVCRPADEETLRLTPQDHDALLALAKADSGMRELLVVFWATWCGPCLEELHILSRHRDLARDHGVAVLAVLADHRDEASARRIFRENAPNLRSCGPDDHALCSAHRLYPAWDGTLPLALILDSSGQARVLAGPATMNYIRNVVEPGAGPSQHAPAR